jgi:2-amino-4-hydroxy-6-hydroxymethyldihydropteridine diphosphokinase/dihydropteroate synthase
MIYLGLGSNLGDRKSSLEMAIAKLITRGFVVYRVSPMIETPAMLMDNARPEWNKPYLNCVVSGQASWTPREGLGIVKEIERQLGREPAERWSPRPVDIDLLVWNDEIVDEEDLRIPHAGICQRSFVLTPLLHLQPDLIIPGQSDSVFHLSQSIKPVPLWMGILNITPDSFSDGGKWNDQSLLAGQIDSFVENNVQIIDLGAESTRPNAVPVSPQEEWRRLESVIKMVQERTAGKVLKSAISVDSRNRQTLEKAIACGIDIINDVTGLSDPDVLALARDSECDVVAMHSVTIPVDPSAKLPTDESAVAQIERWISTKMEAWQAAGMDLNRVIIDPGIGFGTNPMQSQELLGNCRALRALGLRLLIGHSRKSFMSSFSEHAFADRDPETLGISMSVCHQGVDIIRVHDPVTHVRAYRAWSHIEQGRES